jgi:uncharacterized protein YndB with AHSA1/START domain
VIGRGPTRVPSTRSCSEAFDTALVANFLNCAYSFSRVTYSGLRDRYGSPASLDSLGRRWLHPATSIHTVGARARPRAKGRTMTEGDAIVLDGTVTSANGRNDVHFERHFDAPVEDLWAAITEPERMEGWIGGPVDELELKEGGNVIIQIHPAGPATVYGKVTTYDPGHLLELTWDVPAWGPMPDLFGTTMRWEVLPDGSGSKMLLTHSLPVEAGRVHMFLGAWHAHLDELSNTLAGKAVLPFVDKRMFAMREAYAAHIGPVD